ncbi:hypothetical protein QKU48_gp0974 [Fadolivirus algeromassiliense]|jgi:hypothetical protein|uniref:Uncharacterized protein n=1 Tax=Fadolivirus FV1/VV64 TaxID=3070911 RepID=A0A7D3V5X2_9VIRU|nr:hypothetical protein QKU48_gp0974 [Fadolivirus algeromassiliense]QKF94432.1 hypothetical protein Fadolivirus_1_974 [Fadolivirus FV1/VV64]
MKFYLIYFLDYKQGDQVTLKHQYFTPEDAQNDLERIAIEYIKEYQGKQQTVICKQDKTPEQILADNTLREGMYIRKTDNAVLLYEKATVTIPGTIWGTTTQLQVNKIGLFKVTEFVFDDSMVTRCTCNSQNKQPVPRKLSKPATSLDTQKSYIQELQSLIKKGEFKLRSASIPRKSDKISKSNDTIENVSSNSSNTTPDISPSSSPIETTLLTLDPNTLNVIEDSIKSVRSAAHEAVSAIKESQNIVEITVIDNYTDTPDTPTTTDNMNIVTVDTE